MTLAQLALTTSLLGALGLLASRFGMSAIPAYLLAGLLLGPNEPKALSLIRPSEATNFIAELGIIFLLFFIGLEFTVGRLTRTSRYALAGGAIDFVINAGLGIIVGIAAFGLTFGALILAAAVYVSSSTISVKGLIDFRRLADDETGLVLAILVAEDILIGPVLGFAGGGGGRAGATVVILLKAVGFVFLSLAASHFLSPYFDSFLDWLPREFFLLAIVALVAGMAAIAASLGLSEAVGALMAGIALAGTSVREDVEERFFSFRDIFGALFFFVFGLSINVSAIGTVAWILAAAVVATVIGKTVTGFVAGIFGGFNRRQSLNTGIALIAHGEFTIILAQIASSNDRIPASIQSKLLAFAGLYVLVTATIGIGLMKESKALGRWLFPALRLAEGT